jgi:hypothetical protein
VLELNESDAVMRLEDHLLVHRRVARRPSSKERSRFYDFSPEVHIKQDSPTSADFWVQWHPK